MGYASLGVGLSSLGRSSLFAKTLAKTPEFSFKSLGIHREDSVKIIEGFSYEIFIRYGDILNSDGDRFGYNNDFVGMIPLNSEKTDALMWVNHEYPIPLFVSGFKAGETKTKAQVILEQKSVGGSILRVKLNRSGNWEWQRDDKFNRRIDAQTDIPLIADRPIAGFKKAIGTLANCSGGVTPWNTFLTCEENYGDYYGEWDLDPNEKFGWAAHFSNPPEHYGWVVEVDPKKGSAKKLCALGRFSHESATTTLAPDGRCVVYSGDDATDRCLYKFISERPGSLDRGELFVADTLNGKWLSLDMKKNPKLKKRFKDQTEALIHAREAADLVGGTKLNRPEDIEQDPVSKDIFVALTGNAEKGDKFGSLLRIQEKNSDPRSLEFTANEFMMGGPSLGFACPDNLAFDAKGNLWMTSDIGQKSINKKDFEIFGNNSLFYIPMKGAEAGKIFKVAGAPKDAEFTGPCLGLDQKTLFLSVQHPGEGSKNLEQLTSHWPDGGKSVPSPAVIQIKIPISV